MSLAPGLQAMCPDNQLVCRDEMTELSSRLTGSYRRADRRTLQAADPAGMGGAAARDVKGDPILKKTLILSLFLSALAAPVCAQTFARDQNVGVADRPHPELEPLGVKAGGFTLFPHAEAGLFYTDNIRAQATGGESDAALELEGRVDARSNWSRHDLNLHVNAGRRQFLDHGTENTLTYGLGADGRLDINRDWQARGLVGLDHLFEARTEPGSDLTAVDRVAYDKSRLEAGARFTGGRTRLVLTSSAERRDYDDAARTTGGVLDQDYRDNTRIDGAVRAELAISPAVSIYARLAANSRDYRTPVLAVDNRDSTGQRYLVGANFERGLLRGEIEIGGMSQDYDNPAAADIDGGAFSGELTWFTTPLLTLTARGERSAQDSSTVQFGGFRNTEFTVNADYELLRNLIITGYVTHADQDYTTVDRQDQYVQVGLQATWRLNRRVGLRGDYSLIDRDSKGVAAGRSFTTNQVRLTLIYKL